jgi:hypothetical protein
MDIRISNYVYDINKDAVCFDYVVVNGDRVKTGRMEITSADARPFIVMLGNLTREDHEVEIRSME